MLSVFLCWYIALVGFGLYVTRDLEFTPYSTFVDSTGPFFIVCTSFLVTSEYLHIPTAGRYGSKKIYQMNGKKGTS